MIIPRPDILYFRERLDPVNIFWSHSEEDNVTVSDRIFGTLHTTPENTFAHDSLRADLELDVLVDKAFSPRFAPEYVKKVLASASTDKHVIVARQESLEYLLQDNSTRDKVDTISVSLLNIIDRLRERDKLAKTEGYIVSGGRLAADITLLVSYADAVTALSLLSESSELTRRLSNYGKEIQETANFRELQKYIDAFKNRYRFNIEVSIDAMGGVTNVRVANVEQGPSIRKGSLRINSVLSRLGVDRTEVIGLAMHQKVIENVQQINELTFLLGPLDLYLSCLRFYDSMKEKGVGLVLPELLDKGQRRAYIPYMKNPLLLFKKGTNKAETGEDIVPNTIQYGSDDKFFDITGPNSGGKTVRVKGHGLVRLLAQNGLRIPASSDGKVCSISVVDGLYTIFVSTETIVDSAGGQLEYQGLRIKDMLGKATPYSLVLLDEIGRGTSEKEGVEFCLDNIVYPLVSSTQAIGGVTEFSTHLHQLSREIDGIGGVKHLRAEIVNYPDGKLKATYKIIPGQAGQSYARLVEERIGLGRECVDKLLARRGLRTL